MTIQCSQYVYLTSLRQHPVTAYAAHRPGLRLVRLLLNSFSGLLHLLQHQALAHTSRHQGALRLFHFQAAHAYARVAPTAALYQKEKHATWTAQLTVDAVITNSFMLQKRRLLSLSLPVPIARSFTPSTSLREPRHRAASRQRRACTHALECVRISSSSSRPMLESPNAPAPVLANAVASVQLPGPRQWARSYMSADKASSLAAPRTWHSSTRHTHRLDRSEFGAETFAVFSSWRARRPEKPATLSSSSTTMPRVGV